MSEKIIQVDLGGLNCYLIRCHDGAFILVDTGDASMRQKLEGKLEGAGLQRGNLKLIILTHGDVDHISNTDYLQTKYNAQSAMHVLDAEMAKDGDRTHNRKEKPDRYFLPFRLMGVLAKPGELEPFSPDIYLEDGFDLSSYETDARIIHTPGHSAGSISVLTAEGDLICGDLLMNFWKPDYHFLVDDIEAARDSLNRLRAMDIKMVYPGHGRPFSMDCLRCD